MKTAIFYASKHGTARKVVNIIKQKLNNDNIDIYNLKNENNIDLYSYELIVIGGSIHAGKIQSVVSNFIKNNIQILISKKIGLFICYMDETKVEASLEKAFPEILRLKAKSIRGLGGEFIFENMNFFEKLIVKNISKIDNSVSRIDEKEINEFIKEVLA